MVEPTATPGTKGRQKQKASIDRNIAAFKRFVYSIVLYSDSVSSAESPLSRLLTLLWNSWQRVYGSPVRSHFLEWLEHTAPEAIPETTSDEIDLANTLDSLDLILISAIEEAEWLQHSPLEGSKLESYIKKLWAHTYARYATADIIWLERIFVKRSFGVRTAVYPDPDQRKRIYRLGMPPRRGEAFLKVAGRLESYLREAVSFASWTHQARFDYINGLGKLLESDPWFGLRDAKGRHKKPDTPWSDVLKWWLRIPNAEPPLAHQVRKWLSLATYDFEYRLGTAVTAAISAIWDRIHGDELVIPTLDQWGTDTGLPWAAFWLRELLSWGTVEPLVCFLVSSGSASTREEAEQSVELYYDWHLQNYPESKLDDFFHPHHMLEWQHLQFGASLRRAPADADNLEAELANHPSLYPQRSMPVIPAKMDERIAWFDPGGYCLAVGSAPVYWSDEYSRRYDFFLNPKQRAVIPKPIRWSDHV